jgi:hypothetical protein
MPPITLPFTLIHFPFTIITSTITILHQTISIPLPILPIASINASIGIPAFAKSTSFIICKGADVATSVLIDGASFSVALAFVVE